MRLLDHFQRLAEWLPEHPTPTLQDIAAALCCTERNARQLLQRMAKAGWIVWQPGRGRGHRSQIALQAQAEGLRFDRLQSLLREGKLEAAFDGLPSQGRERLMQSLPAYLGPGPTGGLRTPFYRPLHALDPVGVNRRTEAHIVGQICAGLTEFDRERDQIVPALAHHWESEDGGRRWRFWLRPGVRFHDGRAVRPQDVVGSLTRARDTAGPHQALFAHLREIRAVGQNIELLLDQADYLLPHRLAHYAAAIVPLDDWLRPDFASLPIGAGPFRLVRNNDYRATFRAFEHYFRERPLLDEIEIWVVPNHSTLPEVDIRFSSSLPAASHWPGFEQMELGCTFVALNAARVAFADSDVRCQIGAELRQAVAQCTGNPPDLIARGYLPGWHHLPDVPTTQQPTPPRSVRVVTYQLDTHIRQAECVADWFRQRGSEASVTVLSYPEFAKMEWCEWADAVVSGEVIHDDIAFCLYTGLASENIFQHWLDGPTRRWLETALHGIAAEPDAANRRRQLEDAYAYIVRGGWFLPMQHIQQRLAHAPHLGGVSLARCGWMDFRRLWLRGVTN